MSRTDPAAAGPRLDGRSFLSTSVDGHRLVDGSTVRLDLHDGRLAARAGCNTLLGPVAWTDGTLVASDLASTMMACDPALMEQDTWLAGFLTGSPAYELTGSVLVLRDATTTLTFEEV